MNALLQKIVNFFSKSAYNKVLDTRHNIKTYVDGGTLATEQQNINELYQEALELWQKNPFYQDEDHKLAFAYSRDVDKRISKGLSAEGIHLSQEVSDILFLTMFDFIQSERSIFTAPIEPLDLVNTPLKRQTRAREALRRHIRHNKYLDEVATLWDNEVLRLLIEILVFLDPLPYFDTFSNPFLTFEIPLIELAKDPAELVNYAYAMTESDSAAEREFFQLIKWRVLRNYASYLGIENHHKSSDTIEKVVREHPTLEAANALLNGTPLHTLLLADITMPVPNELLFEHMHVLAGAGHGKTQALQGFFLNHLKEVVGGNATIIVMDSQGDLINNIAGLAVFDDELKDKVVHLDPRAVQR